MREDAVALYGFATIEEKKLFLLLNTISNDRTEDSTGHIVCYGSKKRL